MRFRLQRACGERDISRLVAIAITVSVLLAGCGSGDDGSASTVRPFAEVQDSDFEFEADPTTPDRGIFRVTTTEPMICAIVWGETEEFGHLNNSLAMNGTGITQHDVFLPGSTPGRTYYFQVQGTTADGEIYQSDTGTFTIPANGPSNTTIAPEGDGTNLALNATVADVSSEFSESFSAVYALDGSGATEWSTAGDGSDAYITLDLGAPHRIAGVEFITRSMADGTAIAETFTVTVDDAAAIGPFPAGTPVDPRRADVDVTGRLIRFDVADSTGGNVGAVEVRVLAPAG